MGKSNAQTILTKENFVEEIINKGINATNNDITGIVNSCIKAGAGIEITKLEGVACSINSSSYTGNDTVNRAIPHGLGKIPKLYIYVLLDYLIHIICIKREILFVMVAGLMQLQHLIILIFMLVILPIMYRLVMVIY